MHNYPSDISREQFEKIRHILESSRKITRPRSVDLYSIFCGILYILKGGCQWRMLPKEYPKWQTCHYYFRIWGAKANDKSDSLFEEVLKKISNGTACFRGQSCKNELCNYRCPECKKHRHSRK
jgi:transposase